MAKQQSRSQQRTSSRSRSSREAAKADSNGEEKETGWDRFMDRMMPSHLETEPFIKDPQKQQRVRQVKKKKRHSFRMDDVLAVILFSHISEYTMFLSLYRWTIFALCWIAWILGVCSISGCTFMKIGEDSLEYNKVR
jgi:L-rhamnose mutarotase